MANAGDHPYDEPPPVRRKRARPFVSDAAILRDFRAIQDRDNATRKVKEAWQEANPDGFVFADPATIATLTARGWVRVESWTIGGVEHVALLMEDD